jgi:hypothetical protein
VGGHALEAVVAVGHLGRLSIARGPFFVLHGISVLF